MKKVCFVFALLLVGSVALAQTRMVRLTRYEGWPITGVSASGAFDAFDVWLIRSDETRAVVEINEQLEPMLRFEIDSCGVVHVGMDGIRGDIHDVRWRLYLYLNDLTYIRASGASDVDCVGLFESGDVRIELGGASDLRGLELAAAGVVSIEARESSDIDASVRCRELNGTFSGASDAVLSGFSGNLYCNLSGDSDMKVSGTAASFRSSAAVFRTSTGPGSWTAKLPCRGVGCFADCAGTRREGAVGQQQRRVVDHLPGKSVVGLGRSFFHLVGAPGTLIIL